jgi:hypothetical protein
MFYILNDRPGFYLKSMRHVHMAGHAILVMVCFAISCNPREKRGSASNRRDELKRVQFQTGKVTRIGLIQEQLAVRSLSQMKDNELENALFSCLLDHDSIDNTSALQKLFEQDPERVANLLKNIAHDKMDPEIAGVLGKLFANSNSFAVQAPKWIIENLAGAYKILGTVGFAKGLADSDPEKAYAYMQTLPVGHTRDLVGYSVICSYASNDPEKALDIYLQEYEAVASGHTDAVELAASRIIDSMLENFSTEKLQSTILDRSFQKLSLLRAGDTAAKMALMYPAIASEWSLSISDPVKRKTAIQAVATIQIECGNDRLVGDLISRASGTITEQGIIDAFIKGKMKNDATVNISLINALPPSSYDEKVFRTAGQHLSLVDSAFQIEMMEPGLRRDNMLFGLVEQLCASSPYEAKKWALKIQNEKLVREALLIVNSLNK